MTFGAEQKYAIQNKVETKGESLHDFVNPKKEHRKAKKTNTGGKCEKFSESSRFSGGLKSNLP